MVIKKVRKKVEKIPRIIPVKLKEKELEVGLHDVNLRIARLQSQAREVPVSKREEMERIEALRRSAVELTQSKITPVGAQMRQQWFGSMALLRLAEGKPGIAALAIAMGMLEGRAAAAPEGARSYIHNYQAIYNVVASGIPATPVMINRFKTEIEVASIALDVDHLAKAAQKIKPEKRKLVTEALNVVEQRLEEGYVDRARELLDMASIYTDLLKAHKGKPWNGSADMEAALAGEVKGKRAVAQSDMGLSYYRYSLEIEALRTALKKKWSTTLRKPVNDALDRAAKLAEKGEFTDVHLLLTFISHYVDSVGKRGIRRRGMVASLSREDAKLTRGMKDAIGAFATGKAKISDRKAGKTFERSYILAQTAYARERLRGLERIASKLKVGRDTINKAIVEIKRRIKAGNPISAQVLLQYIDEYRQKYGMLTGKDAARIADYREGGKEMLAAIDKEISARAWIAHARSAQYFDSATARIARVKGLQDEFRDFQRRWKGKVPFVDKIPATKGSMPLWEIEKGRYQTLSLDTIRREDRNVSGTKLNEYMKKLQKAVASGDAEAYYTAKQELYDRMALVAYSHLRKGALADMSEPLTRNIEPILKDLKKTYSMNPTPKLKKFYEEAYPPTRNELPHYMEVREKFLHVAALFYEGMPKTEVFPEMKPALKRVAALEKMRAELVKEIQHYRKTKEPMPELLVHQYWQFLKAVDLERKKAATFDAFVRQLGLNENYHTITGQIPGTIESLARDQLRASRKLLEEGCTMALLATSRDDFAAVERRFKDAIHKRRVALGMYSAQALKLRFKKEKLAKKYEGAPQYAFYEDAHTRLFHGMLYGFESMREMESAAKIDEALMTLEFSVFEIPADSMYQVLSDFSGRQEKVRSRIKNAITHYQLGHTKMADMSLHDAKEVKKEMEERVKTNKQVGVVVTIAGSFAAGWATAPFVTGAAFTTQALDGVVTEYSMYNKASVAAWGGLAFMVVTMGIGGGIQMLRSAAEYKAAVGATTYAARLMGTAKALNYTNMALGVSFVGYMSVEATLAFTEKRIFDGLLAAGFAAYPVAAAPRGVELRLSRRRAKLNDAIGNVLPFRGPRPPRGAPPTLGLPRGTLDAIDIMNPATLQNMLEGLTIPGKATRGKSLAARRARMRRNGARATLRMIEAEHPDVANAIRRLSRDSAVRRFIGTGEGAEAVESVLREGAGRIRDMLPPEAVKATEAAEVRLLKVVGAEAVDAIGIEMPKRVPVEAGEPLKVVAMAKKGGPPTGLEPGVAEGVKIGVGKEARVPVEGKEIVIKMEAPPPKPKWRRTKALGRGAAWPFKKLWGAMTKKKGEAEVEVEIPDMEPLFGERIITEGKVTGTKPGELGEALNKTLDRFGRAEDVATSQRVADMLKALSRTSEKLGETQAAEGYSKVLVRMYARLRSRIRRGAETTADQELIALLKEHRVYDSELAEIIRRTYDASLRLSGGSRARFENTMIKISKEGLLPDQIKLLADAVAADAAPRVAAAERLRASQQYLEAVKERGKPKEIKKAERILEGAKKKFKKVTGIEKATPEAIERVVLENEPITRIADLFGAKETTTYNSLMLRYLGSRGRVSVEAMEAELNAATERAEAAIKDMPRAVGRDVVKELGPGEAAKRKDEIMNAMKVLRAIEKELRTHTGQGGDIEKLVFDAFKSEKVGAKIKEVYGDTAANSFKDILETPRKADKLPTLDTAITNLREGGIIPKTGKTMGRLPPELESALTAFVKRAKAPEMVMDFRVIEALRHEVGGLEPIAFEDGAARVMVEDRAIRKRAKKLPALAWFKATWLARGIRWLTLPKWGAWGYAKAIRGTGRRGKLWAAIRWRNSKMAIGQVLLTGAEIWGGYELGPPVAGAVADVIGAGWYAISESSKYIWYWITDVNIDEEREKIVDAWGLRSLSDESVDFRLSDRGEELYVHLRRKFVEAEKRRPRHIGTLKKLLEDESMYVDQRMFDKLMGTIGPELDEKLDDINDLLMEREIEEDKEEVKKKLKKKLKGMDLELEVKGKLFKGLEAVDALLKEEKKEELDIGDLYDLSDGRLHKERILYTVADAVAEAVCAGTGVMTEEEYMEGTLKPSSTKAVEFLANPENRDEFFFLWGVWWSGYVPSIHMGGAITSISTNIKTLREKAKTEERKLGDVLSEHLLKKGLYLETPMVKGSFLDILDDRAAAEPAFRETFRKILMTYKEDEKALTAFNEFKISPAEEIYGDVSKLAETIVTDPANALETARKERQVASYLLAGVDPSLKDAENIELVRFAVDRSSGERGAWQRGILRWIHDNEAERLGKGAPPRHIVNLKEILDDLYKKKLVRRMPAAEIYTPKEGKEPMSGHIIRQLDGYGTKGWWKGPTVWEMMKEGAVPTVVISREEVEEAYRTRYIRGAAGEVKKKKEEKMVTIERMTKDMPPKLRKYLDGALKEAEEEEGIGGWLREDEWTKLALIVDYKRDTNLLREAVYKGIWEICKKGDPKLLTGTGITVTERKRIRFAPLNLGKLGPKKYRAKRRMRRSAIVAVVKSQILKTEGYAKKEKYQELLKKFPELRTECPNITKRLGGK